MSQFESRIMKLRNELFMMKFLNEIEHLKKNDICDMLTDDRALSLTKIINMKNPFMYEKLEPKKKENELNDYFDKINKNAYGQQWNSLPKFHKSIKLKEFSVGLTDVANLQEEIYSKLIDGLNKKHIHTSKTVTYDQNKKTIISINGFEFNKSDNTYTYKYKL